MTGFNSHGPRRSAALDAQLHLVHNHIGKKVTQAIVEGPPAAGGDIVDVFALLESVIAASVCCIAVPGHEEAVLEALMSGVQERIEEGREKLRQAKAQAEEAQPSESIH